MIIQITTRKDGTNSKKDKYEKKLERRVIYLRHFLTYLFYMSNGSPKKLAIYMEKYIRSQERIKKKYEGKTNPIGIQKLRK